MIKKILVLVSIFMLSIVFFIGYRYINLDIMAITLFIVFTIAMIYFFRPETLIISIFLFMFFFFLMGSIFCDLFLGKSNVLNYAFDIDTYKHIYLCLYLSVTTFSFTAIIFDKRKIYAQRKLKTEQFRVNLDVVRIQKISKNLFYICAFPVFIEMINRVVFVLTNGYVSYYVNYRSALGSLAQLVNIYTMSFFIFLGTFPTKRKCLMPFVVYILISFVTLFYGRRGEIFQTILTLISYMLICENAGDGRFSWIKKKYYVYMACLLPFILLFFNYWGTKRVGYSFEISNIFETVLTTIDGQGGSVNVIGYGKELANQFPKGHLYSFGSIMNLLKFNPISEFVFGFDRTMYESNSEYLALYGDSFGSTLTYLWNKHDYLLGRGLGSSFVAVTYFDFGYMGVVIVNIIYALVLTTINHIKTPNIVLTAWGLITLKFLFIAPRTDALDFLTRSSVNAMNIITIIFIYGILSLMVKDRKPINSFIREN